MLVWQSRLNKRFPFEFVIQETSSAGRGNIQVRYHRGAVANSQGARAFQAMLALKMVEQAQELLDDAGAEMRVDVVDLESDERVAVVSEPRASVDEQGEVETVTYEVGSGSTFYEIEVPTQIEGVDVKRGFWARFRPGRKGKPIREMEQVEFDFNGAEVEIDYGDEG